MSVEQMRARHHASNAGSHDDCFGISLSLTTNSIAMQDPISVEILEQCRLQDRKAQRILYEKLFSSSMRVCKRYSSNQEEAMEILNAGFLKVFTQLEKFNGKGSFEGWVHRIMVNTSMDHLRAEKKYHSLFISREDFEYLPEEESINQEDYSDVSLDIMYGMIRNLPQASQMVFNLYVFDNYSHEEISHELGIAEGTSKWHLSNARKILQKEISGLMLNQRK